MTRKDLVCIITPSVPEKERKSAPCESFGRGTVAWGSLTTLSLPRGNSARENFRSWQGGAKKRHLFRGFPFRAGELIADLPSGTACKTGRQTQLLLSLKRARYSDVEAFSRTVSLRSNPGQRA